MLAGSTTPLVLLPLPSLLSFAYAASVENLDTEGREELDAYLQIGLEDKVDAERMQRRMFAMMEGEIVVDSGEGGAT